jgi:hypothetical protein
MGHVIENRTRLRRDVITTGSHFVASSRVLKARFPQAVVYGFFIARRVPETTDFSEFFDDLDDV